MSDLRDSRKCVRRPVSYNSLDAVIVDAERLSAANAGTTGNWTLAQIIEHVATAMDYQMHGFPPALQLHPVLKFVARTLFKKRIFSQGMQPGIRLKGAGAAALVPEPDAIALDDAVEHLRRAVAQLKAAEQCAPHAAFGPLTKAEAELLHRRHAELHMSFVTEPIPCSTSS